MGLAERVKGVWDEYKRDKLGMLGLALLLLFVFVAVAFPLIGDEEVIKNWDNYEYFRFYPKAVPPCWASVLTGEEYTRTIITGGEPVKVLASRGFDKQLGMPYVNVTIEVPVDVTGTKPPSDVLLKAHVFYNSSSQPIYVTELGIVRPDGKRFYLVPPGSREPVSSVFSGLPSRHANLTTVLSFRTLTQNQLLVLRHVLPELQRMGLQVSFVDVPSIVLSLFDALYAKDMAAALQGNSTTALKGRYWWVVKLQGYNATIVFRPEKLAVIGSCYGLMGTDNQGHDLWQGLLYGTRWALIVGLLASGLAIILGAIYGTIAGYFGGAVDTVMMGIAYIVYSLPALPLLILLAALFRPSIWLIIFMLVAFGWPGVSIITRSMSLQIRAEPYVEAARALGASTKRILFLYVMPQILPYVFASIALGVPGAIITEASLSFLGVGDPSKITWGRILHEAEAANAALNGYWWWVVPPGLAIALMGLSFIFIGSALDRILNPRLRR